MKTSKNVFKEQRNLINSTVPPKTIFTIEPEKSSGLFDPKYPYHYHDWYELYYMETGSCTYRVKHKNYTMDEGNIILIPPQNSHKAIYNSEMHKRWLIYFSKDFIDSSLLLNIKEIILTPIGFRSDKDKGFVMSIFEKMNEEFKNPSSYSTLLYKIYLTELLVYLFKHLKTKAASSESGTADLVVDYTLDYIKHHFSEPLSVEDLAWSNGISSGYLSRKFKQSTGIGLLTYIMNVRLDKAKELLTTTDEPITAIAYKCGYTDSNYFSYAFKKAEGISPLKYRKQNS